MTTIDQNSRTKAKTPGISPGKTMCPSTEQSPPAQPQFPELDASIKAPVQVSKLTRLITLLRSADGATIAAMCEATGWQAHSVRGALAGTLKRKGLVVTSVKPQDGPRRYQIGEAS
ncbi:Protein of unknown function DUF3489 [Rhabdaerophilaceae bacterium]